MIKTLTPAVDDLVSNIWAALLTVLIAEYLRIVYTEKSVDIEQLLNRSLKSIDPSLLSYIDSHSPSFNANPNLVKAVCIVENIQRPKWLRRIEAPFAMLGIEGTYGIMQVKSKKLISDQESVKFAIENYFEDTTTLNTPEELKAVIERYNNSVSYIELVEKSLTHLDPNSLSYRG